MKGEQRDRDKAKSGDGGDQKQDVTNEAQLVLVSSQTVSGLP